MRRIRGARPIAAVVRGAALAVVVAIASADAATAQSPQPASPPVVTHHEGTFNGQRVSYTATVAETIVSDASGRPAARIVSIAYTAEGVDPRSRPVLFACNGGPIGPSFPLHMLALGPVRMIVPPDLKADLTSFTLAPNPQSVLDVADIVFFDPASTGGSRVLEGIKPGEYYSTPADAQQFTAFVDRWLHDNNRMASPKYLLGESYATIRLPETAKMLLHLPEPIVIDGLFLMGQAANQLEVNTRPHNILAPIMGLPSVAATAWYHDRIDRKGRTVWQVMQDARQFADAEYLPVLFKGYDALDEATRSRIANTLESFTGIPAAYFLAHDLRITRPAFGDELFKKDGLKLGSDDARYIGPAKGPDPADAPSAAAYQAFLQYAREQLKIDRPDEYRRRQFPVPISTRNGTAAGVSDGSGNRAQSPGSVRPEAESYSWAYGPGQPTPFADFPYVDSVPELFDRNPGFRVVVGSGIYDMKTTTGAAEYLLAQSRWPKDRTRISYYEGGHMAYTNETALRQFTDDIRQLVKGSGR